MHPIPVILIFDIGKTNKKLFVFNEAYKVVYELSTQITELIDEDGFPCEDILALSNWILSSLDTLKKESAYIIKAIHYAAYGASLVYFNEKGELI